MRTKAQGSDVTHGGRTARKRSLSVTVGQLAHEALTGEREGDSASASARAERAVRVYLSDSGAGQPAWPYPKFLEGSGAEEGVGLELDVDPDLWLQFEAEAKRQDVSVQRLLEHAALYFAAELDAGRITQRILDDLGDDEPGDGAS